MWQWVSRTLFQALAAGNIRKHIYTDVKSTNRLTLRSSRLSRMTRSRVALEQLQKCYVNLRRTWAYALQVLLTTRRAPRFVLDAIVSG